MKRTSNKSALFQRYGICVWHRLWVFRLQKFSPYQIDDDGWIRTPGPLVSVATVLPTKRCNLNRKSDTI